MMNKKILLLALACCSTGVKAHDFTDTTGGTVVASFDLSGSELWHNFFLPNNILLAERVSGSQGEVECINHPRYVEQELPVHRVICTPGRNDGNNESDQQDRCTDDFPHVHLDDFKMALNFANNMCGSFGSGIAADFEEPATFVGIDNTPANSHHYYYNLRQGLKFNCVALATY